MFLKGPSCPHLKTIFLLPPGVGDGTQPADGAAKQPEFGAAPQYGQQAQYGQNQQPKRSGLAITALVLGIITLLLCWVPIFNNIIFIVAIVGLIFGIIAMVMVKKNPTKRRGFGMALAGLILSVVSIAGVLITQSIYSKALDAASKAIDDTYSSAAAENAPGSLSGRHRHRIR